MLFSSLLVSTVLAAAPATTDIKVSQVGYPTSGSKVAFVVSAQPAGAFVVRDAGSGASVFEGHLGAATADADSGDATRVADFSRLDRPGTYILEVPEVGRSFEFAVGPAVFDRALRLAMLSFYAQRCGTAVDLGPEFPGFRYPACHRTGAYHASTGRGGPHPSEKGWHDAGDYGRYIVNSSITVGTLLWGVEMYPRLRELKLPIPETGNAVPDVLDEIRWNLDWMLSMQDQDGGVWHKQTSESFPGFVMPQDDTTVSVVVGTGREPYKGTCATADFAAATAIASRVFEAHDPAYAKRMLEAARRAFAWAEAHPDLTYHNPPGISTGAYGDERCGDEVLWAAAELWRTAGDAAAHRTFLAHQAEYRAALRPDDPPAWPNVAPLALWTYALAARGDEAVQAAIRNESLAAADALVARTTANGYRVSLTTRDYGWGSNGVAANYGLQLLVAHALRRDRRYLETARDNLYYLLGRNTFSLSWVTRVGQNPFRHPHHRPSAADANAEPWPGFLSGGPNQKRQDAKLTALPEGLPPAKMYVDHQDSYASNENAINWNAPLVFLLAGAAE